MPDLPRDEDARSDSDPDVKSTRELPGLTAQRDIRIGSYLLLEVIGAGGMGEVWLAEQTEPIRRRVALKIIRRGLDNREIIARFESERQALALLNHPNIARVFDGGETRDGLPYFVMEYIAGIPVTEYCDKNRLSTPDRLELFIKLCDAVQHAHQRGIIHRDLKPSNVLVVEENSRAEPKVIDFGLAKALVLRLTEKSFFTQHGAFVGTPSYMSPEQADGGGVDVDTRTDVYSLGVLLYELLIGALPLDPTDLRKAGMDEMRRWIREVEPPRPSVRLTSLGGSSQAVAHRRRVDFSSLVRQIRGDLDWIAMRSLEKDRARRYGSASDLAADLRRHLKNEPVIARPPSRIYKMQRFMRRHPAGTAAVALIALTITVGGIATSLALVRALRAEKAARQEAETARQATNFMRDLFKVSDPSEARGSKPTAREVLDRGAARVEKELASQPAIQARLLATLGVVYTNLGEFERAEELMTRGVAIRRSMLKDDRAGLGESLSQLAWLYYLQNEYDRSMPLAREALALQEAQLGKDDPAVATTLHTMASIEDMSGDHAGAADLFQRTLAIREKAFGTQSIEAARSLNSLGVVYKSMGDFKRARGYYERALAIAEHTVGADSPNAMMWLNNLGSMLSDMGNYDEAATLHRRCLVLRERVLPPDHPDIAQSLDNLANCLVGLNQSAQAIPLYRKAAEIFRKAYGEDNLEEARVLGNLAIAIMNIGKLEEAESMLARVIRIEESRPGPGDTNLGFALTSMGDVETKQRRFADAERDLRRALALRERIDGKSSWTYALSLASMAKLRSAQGMADSSSVLYAAAVRTLVETLGETSPDVRSVERDWATVLKRLGQMDQAHALEARMQSVLATAR